MQNRFSHFNVVWERLVLMVKRAYLISLCLRASLQNLFRAIVVEKEGLLNSPPWIQVSSEIEDEFPLKINSFLTARSFLSSPSVMLGSDSSQKIASIS